MFATGETMGLAEWIIDDNLNWIFFYYPMVSRFLSVSEEIEVSENSFFICKARKKKTNRVINDPLDQPNK